MGGWERSDHMGSASLGVPERAALADFVCWVRGRFGGRVRELQLFGSRARGEADAESDVDVLVVIAELTPAERREVARKSGDAMTEQSVLLSPFVMSAEYVAELRARERRVVREIDRDGIPL